jgi:hypothetical protein
MAKIALCTPHRAWVLKRWTDSIARLGQELRELGHETVQYTQEDNALIEHARSELCSRALAEGADVLFCADDDTEWEDGHLLVTGALETESLVAAPVAIRGGSRLNVTFADGVRVKFFKHGKLREITNAGTGLTAIHRACFEAMKPKLEPVQIMEDGPLVWPFFRSVLIKVREDDELHRWCGEDQSFVWRLGTLGFKLWCDTRVRARHFTPQGWRVEDVLRQAIPDDPAPEGTWR